MRLCFLMWLHNKRVQDLYMDIVQGHVQCNMYNFNITMWWGSCLLTRIEGACLPNVTVEGDSDGNFTPAGNESAALSLRRV